MDRYMKEARFTMTAFREEAKRAKSYRGLGQMFSMSSEKAQDTCKRHEITPAFLEQGYTVQAKPRASRARQQSF